MKKFSVGAWQDEKYQPVAQRTSIGNRRILRFLTVTTSKIRVNIEKASLLIRLVELYNAPERIVTPVISRSKAGLVTIACPRTTDPVITYTTNSSEPTVSSQGFRQPFARAQVGP